MSLPGTLTGVVVEVFGIHFVLFALAVSVGLQEVHWACPPVEIVFGKQGQQFPLPPPKVPGGHGAMVVVAAFVVAAGVVVSAGVVVVGVSSMHASCNLLGSNPAGHSIQIFCPNWLL